MVVADGEGHTVCLLHLVKAGIFVVAVTGGISAALEVARLPCRREGAKKALDTQRGNCRLNKGSRWEVLQWHDIELNVEGL